jgi:hypothetical protein
VETLIAACPPVAWVALLTVGRAEASMLIASTTAAAAHSRAGTTDRELVVGADAPGGIALFCVAPPRFPRFLSRRSPRGGRHARLSLRCGASLRPVRV